MPLISRLAGNGDASAAVYQITDRGANLLLFVEESLTLVDTGRRNATDAILGCIRGLGRKPEELHLIILTHNHVDHVGSLADLRKATRARVAMHCDDIGEREGLPSAGADAVDVPLRGGEVLEPAGGILVIHTPGHTPGSISLFARRERLLAVGDAVRKRRDVLDLPFQAAGFDRERAEESVRRLSAIDAEILCLGHGLPINGEIRARMQDLAERFRR